MISTKNLKKTWKPNQFLMCPEGHSESKPDMEPKVYSLSAADLAREWRAVIGNEPRTSEVEVAGDGLHMHHTQKTPTVGFTDDIYTEVVPAGDDKAQLHVYSRSRVGISDRGVNKKRIKGWLALLDQKTSAS